MFDYRFVYIWGNWPNWAKKKIIAVMLQYCRQSEITVGVHKSDQEYELEQSSVVCGVSMGIH